MGNKPSGPPSPSGPSDSSTGPSSRPERVRVVVGAPLPTGTTEEHEERENNDLEKQLKKFNNWVTNPKLLIERSDFILKDINDMVSIIKNFNTPEIQTKLALTENKLTKDELFIMNQFKTTFYFNDYEYKHFVSDVFRNAYNDYDEPQINRVITDIYDFLKIAYIETIRRYLAVQKHRGGRRKKTHIDRHNNHKNRNSRKSRKTRRRN